MQNPEKISSAEEVIFDVQGTKIAAKVWGPTTGAKVLAIHGWMDNANSFANLAPMLDGIRVVAVDTAGHGFSDHRSTDGGYNIWDDLPDLMGVVDQLGWQQFSLLGHSRGAIISMLIAGTFPQRVQRAIMLDGFWPDPVEPANAPQQLAKSILDRQKLRSVPAYHDSIEPFVKARENGLFKLSPPAARLLAERNVILTADGYRWSSDTRLKNASALKLTAAHIEAFVAAIQAQVKVVIAEQGIPICSQAYMDQLRAVPSIALEIVPGTHHLHLEPESVQRVADIVKEFICRPS